MSGDASLPPHAPMTNGTGHGEADASSESSRPLSEVCADLNARVSAFLTTPPKNDTFARTQEQTRIAINVIDKALEDFGFEGLSLSYNGGKDCLVLLVLYLSVLHAYFTQPSSRRKETVEVASFPSSVPSIYAKPPDPFPAVTSFVESSSRAYHLELVHISTSAGPDPNSASSISTPPGPPTPLKRVTFRDAFAYYLTSRPSIHAIFVGTRRTDPHGGQLTHFDRTDKGWPDFMRVHPVIDWHLSEIWCFLRADELRERDGTHLPYCEMYDQGYTSLGGVGDTLRNPKLKDGDNAYRPAYELTKDGEERLGRE